MLRFHFLLIRGGTTCSPTQRALDPLHEHQGRDGKTLRVFKQFSVPEHFSV
jgi:hypothetical protein